MNLLWDVGFYLGWVIAACWLAALGANRVRGRMLARRDSADPEFPSPSHGADIARGRAVTMLGVAQMEADGVLKPGSLDRVLGVAAARDPFAHWDGKRFVPAAGAAMAHDESAIAERIERNFPAWTNAKASGNVLNRTYWHPEVAKRTEVSLRGALTGAPFALALAALLTLSACGTTTPAQQQSLAAAGVTLAAIAAQNNTTVASIVTKGALFCELGGGAGIVAVVNAAGAPVTVKDQSAQAVAAACMAFQAVSVAPPVDPGAVPSMAAPAALPAVKA